MTQNRYKNKNNILPLIITAVISICIPFGLYSVLKPTTVIEPVTTNSYDPGYGRDIMIIQAIQTMSDDIISSLNQLAIPVPEPAAMIQANVVSNNVTWLDSPVMQAWIYNEKARVWETAVPYKDSFRSSPTLIFGLRDDGVVIWNKVSK